MVQNFQVMQSIFAATKLGIPDLIGDAQKSCDELANATDTKSDQLYFLLKALAGVGIFVEIEPKCFQLAPLGTCLLNEPSSMRNYVLFQGEIAATYWRELIHTLRNDQSAFEYVYGMEIYECCRQKPHIAMLWDGMSTNLSTMHNSAILASYDFSFAKKIADIGGGQGTLLAAILKQYSSLQGVLFEQSKLIEEAKNFLSGEEIIDRCKLVVGNFCESVPTEPDVYIIKNVLSSQEEPIATKLLENLYQAMAKSSKLLVIQRIISDTRWTDNFSYLNSLLVSRGKFMTEDELEQLLKGSGFKIVKIIHTESVVSIVECVPNK